MSLDVGDAGRVVRHVGKDEPLFVVVLAEDLVLAQVEAVAHTEPETRHAYCHHVHQLYPAHSLHLQKDISQQTTSTIARPLNSSKPEIQFTNT